MKGMFNRLPSFSPDYCGAAGVFYEMNGLTIMCDPGPCTGTVLAIDEPRMNMDNCFHCMQIGQKQAVFGFDQELLENARKVLKEHDVEFVAILGTPISATLATDYRGLAGQLSREFHVPGFGVDTKSIDTYDVGQRKAFDILARQAVNPVSDGSVDVNVLGATPLDMWDVNQVNDLVDLLKECGARNPSVWGRNGKLPQIGQAAGARLNLAVSVSAIPAVKMLQRKYGTPYLVGFPIGEKQEECWKDKLCSILGCRSMQNNQPAAAYGGGQMKEDLCQGIKNGKRALVVGEQISSNAIRDCLRNEFDYDAIHVASFFMMDPEFMEEGDQTLPDEEALRDLSTKDGAYDLVICDPLMYPLLPYEPVKTMPWPHTAVSGRIFWSRSANFFGAKGTEYMRGQIGDKDA